MSDQALVPSDGDVVMLNGSSDGIASASPPSSSNESPPIRHFYYQVFDSTPTPVLVRRPIDPSNFTIARLPIPEPAIEQTVANLKICIRLLELVDASRDITAYVHIQPPRTPLPDDTLLVDLLNSWIGATPQTPIAIVVGNPPPPNTPVITAGPPPNFTINLSPMLLPSPILTGIPNSPIETLPPSIGTHPNSLNMLLSHGASYRPRHPPNED